MHCSVCGRSTTTLFTVRGKSFCFRILADRLEIWYGQYHDQQHGRVFYLPASQFRDLLTYVQDALAEGHVVYAAARAQGVSIEDWLLRENYHTKVQNYLCAILAAIGAGHLENNPDRITA